MIPKLLNWYDAIRKEDPSAAYPEVPTEDRRRDPLRVLPRDFEWTDDLEAWANIDYQKPMSGYQMLMLQRACVIRGANAGNHSERRRQFSVFVNELGERGFTVPATLQTTFGDDDLFDLFRFPCQSFELPDSIAPFPGDERLVLFLLLSDAQGCNFTHLLLAPNGEHVVTRSSHPYGLDDADDYSAEGSAERQLFLCADCFDTLICTAVDEINQFEREAASDWLVRGNQLRDAGESEDAEQAYRLGLAYDPSCPLLQDRLRSSKND